ncbi:TPA: hypothetical protein QDC20_000327 [Burkholderia aenigmatica]|uniref:DUF4760 domain-containing protein n=1 Tax=Burkholderia sp. AU45251 TaxID=3059204 RepID=UPI00264E2420|nr:hypothetical protein [Burkholderia sp. AU45251]HDR9483228.1 hypothetical protein [Burkholderia aenigmatica]MDN7516093.1 hypothetical protein [Burkholderia sp. AU45251]HDR9514176.1 hypothetical protein [Burkholderia aenigmatica]HDR9591566.1 hypothetical protein [Burkholderia aenigmatica]HDR9598658.1 hypothetical protein [Burkholderia aenigmatica]
MDHAAAEGATAWATIATAIASWLLAGVTMWMVRVQIGEAKRATGLQLFSQIVRDFQEPGMRSLRRAFATELLAARLHEPTRNPLTDESVLEFFENLAYLTRDRVLDRRIVWNYFSIAVEGYWHACRDFVFALRTAELDEDLYSDLEWLATEMASITLEHARRQALQSHTPERVNEYLRSEQALTT